MRLKGNEDEKEVCTHYTVSSKACLLWCAKTKKKERKSGKTYTHTFTHMHECTLAQACIHAHAQTQAYMHTHAWSSRLTKRVHTHTHTEWPLNNFVPSHLSLVTLEPKLTTSTFNFWSQPCWPLSTLFLLISRRVLIRRPFSCSVLFVAYQENSVLPCYCIGGLRQRVLLGPRKCFQRNSHHHHHHNIPTHDSNKK